MPNSPSLLADAPPAPLTPCLDTQSDPLHCGVCGNQCFAGDTCQAGVCVSPCGPDQAWCSGQCVDLSTDPGNCGVCGNGCGTGVCAAGQCAATCPTTVCPTADGDRCVDPSADNANCGVCGNACNADQACVSGTCVLDCAVGESACGDTCAQLQSSVEHCGACGVACTENSLCQAGTCQCQDGFSECGDSCADFTSDEANCGACGVTCEDHLTCAEGQCACADGQVECEDSCADLQSDTANCGGCGIACGEGFACAEGSCVCPDALTACDDQCVDATSDDQNCGACGEECLGGSTCQDGACACPEGQELCGDECVDVASSTDHCGACGATCDTGDTCDAGQCRGLDGCLSTPVSDLDILQFAAYQTVKIPLTSRNDQRLRVRDNTLELVRGRDAMMRVFVGPKDGYQARELSARLVVESIGMEEPLVLFQKKRITRTSSDQNLDSTFVFDLPGEAIAENMQYSVSVVSCEGEQPDVEQEELGARFPQEGLQSVRTIETGPIKVHLFPLDDGRGAPDINNQMLQEWGGRLQATFPNSGVEFTVRDRVRSNSQSMCGHLGTLRTMRAQERAPGDVYWYGVTNGPIGNASGCSGRSTNVRSTAARVSAGIARTTRGGYRRGSSTFTHELGHAGGRTHVDCGGPATPDPNYPFNNGDTGGWGYDFRERSLLPPSTKDMMSYCPRNDRASAWVSAYTYQNLMRRQQALFELGQRDLYLGPENIEEPVGWRVLMATSEEPSWTEDLLLVQGKPEGEPQSAIVSDASGFPLATVTVYKEELHDDTLDHRHMFTVPTPGVGWHTLSVPGLPPVLF